ncbi:MAG: phosphatidylinositol kinase [Bacteroidetes bacterium]|uniref:Phosphatidylinositol kinase n=1 Tax=Phaeocystidibacter marisrubri TaxID=1577780 RepID=A0A6L3ZG48_9FLAO|nr:HipA N-terminal domain-containing protein [Phaeocystidibacter marisrubri]KAB2816314.1 phosphatidylinositol kinase [Phaeocystidibacter marisrubri]TNE30243.1 MAG: phosphatidylinositol kinase [Bacteroidota bacterium]GGH68407.1 phosphatidylinositol kinase [Phaeocystidibacter marisrubri]
MRKARVYRNGQFAGVLTEHNRKLYTFEYTDEWISNRNLPPISLTLPKSQKRHTSPYLFPFFFNMLTEGVNRKFQARQLKIDEADDFGMLLALSGNDRVGAVSIKEFVE